MISRHFIRTGNIRCWGQTLPVPLEAVEVVVVSPFSVSVLVLVSPFLALAWVLVSFQLRIVELLCKGRELIYK